MAQFLTSTLHLSSEGNFIPSFVGCPRIFAYPQTGYWAWPFFTPFAHMRLDIGSGLLRCSLNAGLNWPPQYLFASWASCGAELSLAFKLYWRRPAPISSLIRTNGVRKGQAQYPVWGQTNIRGQPTKEGIKLSSEERWSMLVRNWAVSEDDGHLETFVRGIWWIY